MSKGISERTESRGCHVGKNWAIGYDAVTQRVYLEGKKFSRLTSFISHLVRCPFEYGDSEQDEADQDTSLE